MKTEIGKSVEKAAEWLRKGEVVAVPTETVYGLAADALNREAVKKIFQLKGRPSNNPLILHLSHEKELSRYVAEIPPEAEKLIEAFWPGPLTLVLKKKEIVPYEVTAGLETVAVRVPDHPLLCQVIQKLGSPIAAPSANPSGRVSATNVKMVEEYFKGKIPYILNGGDTVKGLESTVVAFQEGKVLVYRLGALSLEKLKERVERIELWKRGEKTESVPSPGLLYRHYAPVKALWVGEKGSLIEKARREGSRVALLNFKEYSSEIEKEFQRVLSERGDIEEAARNFYRTLYELDRLDVDVIIAEFLPDEGAGRVINDRLRRASR